MTTPTLEDDKMTTSRPATRDFLKKKKASTRSVDILLDTELLDEQERLLEKLDGDVNAQERKKLDTQLRQLRESIAENTVTMKFHSIGRKAYEALVEEHPATATQIKKSEADGQDAPPYDVEVFPRELIRQSCYEPELTEEDVDEIYDNWNQGEVMELFMTAMLVNTQRRTADLGNAFGPIRN